MTEQATETNRCHIGIRTDTQCPFTATEPFPGLEEKGHQVCAYHAADDALYREIDEYATGLEKINQYLEDARGADVTEIVGDLERLQSHYKERLEFFQGVAEQLSEANKTVTVYRGD